jgi:hypothetical protein
VNVKALREAAVTRYVQGLRDAGTDKIVFDEIYDQLIQDPAVRKMEADAIAHAYTGGRPAWPTKREALEAIKRWYRAVAFNETKMRRV